MTNFATQLDRWAFEAGEERLEWCPKCQQDVAPDEDGNCECGTETEEIPDYNDKEYVS